MDLNLSTDSQVFVVGLRLAASTSNIFDLTEVASNPPWTATGNDIVGGIDPESGSYGTILPDPLYFGPGLTRLATLGVAVPPDCLIGDYTLGVTGVMVGGLRIIPEERPGTPGPDVLVHVVPEPGHIAMILSCGLFFNRRWL